MLDSKRGRGGRDAQNKTEEGKENTNQHNCCCGGYYHLPVKNLISVNVFQKDFFFFCFQKKKPSANSNVFLIGVYAVEIYFIKSKEGILKIYL